MALRGHGQGPAQAQAKELLAQQTTDPSILTGVSSSPPRALSGGGRTRVERGIWRKARSQEFPSPETSAGHQQRKSRNGMKILPNALGC